MGNEGYVQIWRVSDVLSVWPDAEEKYIPQLCRAYFNKYELPELGPVYVGYYGDLPGMADWDESDARIFGAHEDSSDLEKFAAWMHAHAIADWEVWT